MTCEEFEEISGAYALDAITPTEREEVEKHLASCARCTRLYQELRGVVTLLPLSVPQINPPEALQERVMKAIRQEHNGLAAQPAQQRPPVIQLNQQRAKRRWQPGMLVAAAVLLLCLLGGSFAWNLSLHQQVAALQQQLANTAHVNQPSTNVQSYTVKGTTNQGAVGQLIYFAKQDITVLVMHGLPRLEGAHVYQGWLLHVKGKDIKGVTSIGLLNIANGTASLSFAGNVTGYDAAAISMEPGPTATPNAPKGSVVALGSLTSSS